jgi:hypothetical protein
VISFDGIGTYGKARWIIALGAARTGFARE